LKKPFESFKKGVEEGVAKLFTAFYFRQHEERRSGEATFEFTHKSSGEYLTARRLVRALERMDIKFRLHESHDYEEGWSERKTLSEWVTVYGDAPRMTQDLFRFVRSEIELSDPTIVGNWQTTLCALIGWMLQNGMPMELLAPRPPYYQQEMQAAIRAEEAMLAILYACACVTEKVSEIHYPSPTSMGEWLNRLQGQRLGGENVLALQCLGFLNLEDSSLVVHDLIGANMHDTNLIGAQLTYAHFGLANLTGVSLDGASLEETHFTGNTTLPDGTQWSPSSDLSRFTDPDHPDFWRPDTRY
jgi:hypothetical protein